MSTDPFHERGRSLEDLFYKDVDQKLRAKMRDDLKNEQSKKALSEATGITEDRVLQAMINYNISPETIVAAAFIPLVAVAWSDGILEPKEREAIERAFLEQGVDKNSPAFQLAQHWLDKKPPSDLVATWKSYMQLLKNRMPEAEFSTMRTNTLERATKIAKAAGGFLGLGAKISETEQKVLDDLRSAL
jgi:hypothetical protein